MIEVLPPFSTRQATPAHAPVTPALIAGHIGWLGHEHAAGPRRRTLALPQAAARARRRMPMTIFGSEWQFLATRSGLHARTCHFDIFRPLRGIDAGAR